jgi:hypothetical protein
VPTLPLPDLKLLLRLLLLLVLLLLGSYTSSAVATTIQTHSYHAGDGGVVHLTCTEHKALPSTMRQTLQYMPTLVATRPPLAHSSRTDTSLRVAAMARARAVEAEDASIMKGAAGTQRVTGMTPPVPFSQQQPATVIWIIHHILYII